MRHYLLLGQTGAGKSSLARAMIPYFSRVLVLDKHWEYGPKDGCVVIEGFRAFSELVTRDIRGSWRVAFRTSVDEEWAAAVAFTYYIQEQRARAEEFGVDDPPSTLIIVEEVGLFSSPQKLPPWLGNLFNYGRHYGITAVGIVRQDTETHKILRNNSTKVFFRLEEITGSVAKGLGLEKTEQIANLPLYEWRSGNPPVGGVHYLTRPDCGDVLQVLKGRQRLRVISQSA